MQIPYEEELCALAEAVWETPEPGFREYKSSAAHVEFLKKHVSVFMAYLLMQQVHHILEEVHSMQSS